MRDPKTKRFRSAHDPGDLLGVARAVLRHAAAETIGCLPDDVLDGEVVDVSQSAFDRSRAGAGYSSAPSARELCRQTGLSWAKAKEHVAEGRNPALALAQAKVRKRDRRHRPEDVVPGLIAVARRLGIAASAAPTDDEPGEQQAEEQHKREHATEAPAAEQAEQPPEGPSAEAEQGAAGEATVEASAAAAGGERRRRRRERDGRHGGAAAAAADATTLATATIVIAGVVVDDDDHDGGKRDGDAGGDRAGGGDDEREGDDVAAVVVVTSAPAGDDDVAATTWMSTSLYRVMRKRMLREDRRRRHGGALFLPSVNQITEAVGSWQAALELAGLPTPDWRSGSRGLSVAEALDLCFEQHRVLPTQRELMNTWRAAQDLPISRQSRSWPEELAAFRARWLALGIKVPASLPPKDQRPDYTLKHPNLPELPGSHVRKRRLSDSELVDCVVVYLEDLEPGAVASAAGYRHWADQRPDRPSIGTLTRRSSWAKVLAGARERLRSQRSGPESARRAESARSGYAPSIGPSSRQHSVRSLGRGQVRVEDSDDGAGEDASNQLGEDERGHGCRCDAGEGVAEDAADVDRGVGEARRAGEEVGGADVGADRRRRQVSAAGSGEREDHEHEAEGGDDLSEDVGAGGAVGLGDADRAQVEHQVGDDGAGDATEDLDRHVGEGGAPGQAAEARVDQGHDRIEVAS